MEEWSFGESSSNQWSNFNSIMWGTGASDGLHRTANHQSKLPWGHDVAIFLKGIFVNFIYGYNLIGPTFLGTMCFTMCICCYSCMIVFANIMPLVFLTKNKATLCSRLGKIQTNLSTNWMINLSCSAKKGFENSSYILYQICSATYGSILALNVSKSIMFLNSPSRRFHDICLKHWWKTCIIENDT